MTQPDNTSKTHRGRWFRVYESLVDDPKVQLLPAAQFKILINLWCLACRSSSGRLPAIQHLSYSLRISVEGVQSVLKTFCDKGLLEETEDGYVPHNWGGRQYASDVSTERVKRFRERQKHVSETPPDTDTDTDTEAEKKEGGLTPLAILLTVLDEPHAKAVLDHRRRKRSSLSKTTAGLLVRELGKCPDPNAAVEEMLLRGWTSVKAEWIENATRSNHQAPMSAKERAVKNAREIGIKLVEEAQAQEKQNAKRS